MIDVGWQYGSLTPTKPEPEPMAAEPDDISALLDSAEEIVNAAGAEMIAEQQKKQKRKLFRKKKKRR